LPGRASVAAPELVVGEQNTAASRPRENGRSWALTAERMLRALRACRPSGTIVVASHDPRPLDVDASLVLVGTTTGKEH